MIRRWNELDLREGDDGHYVVGRTAEGDQQVSLRVQVLPGGETGAQIAARVASALNQAEL